MTSPEKDLHAELHQLKAEIGAKAAFQRPPADAGEAATAAEFRQLIQQLEAAVRESTDHFASEAEEIVTAHPVATIAAAFALGILVGHLWRRSA